MPTAIVTGATGEKLRITGGAVVERLLADKQWTEIITLSRSKPGMSDPRIKHATLDLMSSASAMSKALAGIKADFVFFCAYLADPDEAEACDINGALLQNFLDALAASGATKQLTRLVLVNGLKQYGVHLGQAKNPMHETDAWIEQKPFPPNFYYTQQRILQQCATNKAKYGDWTYAVTYPQDVIGVAKGNFMNLISTLGLYCLVMPQVPGMNGELPFPGSKANYLAMNCWSSAPLHADFCIWAALEPKAANQTFNVINGDTESWQNLWPKVVKRFGAKTPANMFPGGEHGSYKDFKSSTTTLPTPPPVTLYAREMGLPASKFESSVVHQQVDTTEWSKRPDVIKAWEKIRDQHGLDQATWDKATWGFITFLLGREYSCVASMSKARSLGWTGYKDTWQSFEEAWDTLEELKMLPKRKGL